MSLPMLFIKDQLSDFTQDGSWDGLILIVGNKLDHLEPEWQEFIKAYRSFDLATTDGVHLVSCHLAPDSRLLLCSLATLDHEASDLRLIHSAASQAMQRALQAGIQRPCLRLALAEASLASLESSCFGALSALWVPLEARELAKGGSIEALGIVSGHVAELHSPKHKDSWSRWLSAVEHGRIVARDICGTEPERMSPPKLAELCKKIFRGTSIDLEIVKERRILEQEYPLLSAVARASWSVDRHHPRVIKLRYQGQADSDQLIALAGKGVTYDTGGADLKVNGHMAGMSRDKGGAAAVIGFMLAVAYLKPKLNFIAEIGAVRNSIGSDAFVTDEIITSHAGVRVRIGNTDAEGRLVLADFLSNLRTQIKEPSQAHLMSIATLTGHAYRAYGPFTIAIDNPLVHHLSHQENQDGHTPLFDASSFQHDAEKMGEGVEISRLRTEDFQFVAPRSLSEEVISSNTLPSTATPRGHQFPAAFLIKASGLSNDGLSKDQLLEQGYRFSHLDIGGSGVSDGDWQHGRPTAAPVMGLSAYFFHWSKLCTILMIMNICAYTLSVAQANELNDPESTITNFRESPLLPNEAMGTGAMVVSDNALASKIGIEMIQAGGDAVDAAIATTLALGVLQPFASGIGGGGFAVVYRRNKNYALDFRESAPKAAHANMYLDQSGKVIKNKSTIGALAAGTPGEIAGLYELHKRHGKLTWKQVVAPAQNLAQHGFLMHKLLHKQVQSAIKRVKYSPSLTLALLNQNGTVKELGKLIRFPKLAKTLNIIAEQGAKGFYEGSVAKELVESVQSSGGIITLEDLKSYRVKERQVLKGKYLDYELLTMPPPSSGGLVIIQALQALEQILNGRDPADLGRHSGTYLHMLTEVLKHGFADRAEYMGDPDFYPVPVKQLLSNQRIHEIVSKFKTERTLASEEYGARVKASTDGGTSHLNVIDAQGNAIALTTTINTGFGSRFVAGKTGVLLNNEMDDFIMKPGVPNAYGLIGKASNAVQAYKRPLSSMSPTIILKEGKVKGLVGASGGPTIITGTIQTLLNLIHFDGEQAKVGNAVSMPRIHHQWMPEILMYDDGLPKESLTALLARQHRIKAWPMRFTSVQALWLINDKKHHKSILVGASDPSKLGKPAVLKKLK